MVTADLCVISFGDKILNGPRPTAYSIYRHEILLDLGNDSIILD
jgi:hypothetical protein